MPGKPKQIDLDFQRAAQHPGRSDDDLRERAELAIGEYLARKRTIWPDMPIARILKALERQGISFDEAPRALELMGARLSRVPEYVAKFNFRVTFPPTLLDRCQQIYRKRKDQI